MKTYAVTDSTGAVLRIVRQDAPPMESGIELPADTPMSWPVAPHEGAALVASNGALTWRDDRTLAEARAQAWAKIKAARQAAIESPKVTSQGTFDADIAAQDNLSKVIAMLRVAIARGYPDAARFTLANNERKTFTLAQLETAALEIGAQVQADFDTGDELRKQIDATTNTADLGGMRWPT
jgi:hypothetical protein